MRAESVLITGAAGSLGSALAERCAERGWATVLLDKDQRGLERLFDRIEAEGWQEPILHPMDLAIAGPDEVQEMLDAIAEQLGGLDALVHCAARFEALTPLEHVQPAEWLQTVQVNLNAAWLLTSRSLPLLRQAEFGRLYFLLEDLARVGKANWGPYGICKHALHAMIGQLAAETQGTRIQVLGIDPGPMQSPLRARAYVAENPANPAPPTLAAEAIADVLSGKERASGLYLDLSPGAGQ